MVETYCGNPHPLASEKGGAGANVGRAAMADLLEESRPSGENVREAAGQKVPGSGRPPPSPPYGGRRPDVPLIPKCGFMSQKPVLAGTRREYNARRLLCKGYKLRSASPCQRS